MSSFEKIYKGLCDSIDELVVYETKFRKSYTHKLYENYVRQLLPDGSGKEVIDKFFKEYGEALKKRHDDSNLLYKDVVKSAPKKLKDDDKLKKMKKERKDRSKRPPAPETKPNPKLSFSDSNHHESINSNPKLSFSGPNHNEFINTNPKLSFSGPVHGKSVSSDPTPKPQPKPQSKPMRVSLDSTDIAPTPKHTPNDLNRKHEFCKGIIIGCEQDGRVTNSEWDIYDFALNALGDEGRKALSVKEKAKASMVIRRRLGAMGEKRLRPWR